MERNNASETSRQKDTYMDMVPWVDRYLHLRHKLVVEGTENIPEGPAMLVANHLAFDDSLAIASAYAHAMNRPLRLGAKSEYFEGKGVNNKGLFGKTIQKFVIDTQQIPVYRDSDRNGTVQLNKHVKRLFARGESLLFHGEGTRSTDGRLNRLKPGAATFAIKNSVPIEPVSITYEKMQFSLRTIALVQFGKPLMPVDYGMEFHHYPLIPDRLIDAVVPRMMSQKERTAKVTDILEEDIARMSGQERSGYFLDPYTKKLIIPESTLES
jgi:1-acyl-sn-glycerol-3-phosphate acyltransferase